MLNVLSRVCSIRGEDIMGVQFRARRPRQFTLFLVVAGLVAALMTIPARAYAALPAGGMSPAQLADAFRTYGDTSGRWNGGDSTTSVPLPDGRLVWLFSDTFLGPVNADGSRPHSAPMVHNSAVVQDGVQLTQTLTG